MKKIGRNDPCWCGSQKKFKYCHLNRHIEEPEKPYKLEAIRKDAFGKRYCMFPKGGATVCSKDIVQAHTVPRSMLNKIAVNGHVISFMAKNSIYELIEDRGIALPDKLGIKKASVFTGFCETHDKLLFAPIEDQPFRDCAEHSMLWGYRAVCRELFLKESGAELTEKAKEFDKGMPEELQYIYQNFTGIQNHGFKLGARDLRYLKILYDEAILNKDYTQIRYYILTLDSVPEIMCSGIMVPTHDYYGNFLQDIESDEVLDFITCSIIVSGDKGKIVFAWFGNSEPCNKFIESLNDLKDEELPDSVFRFVITFFENFYCSPIWWDKLGETVRNQIIKMFQLEFSQKEIIECMLPDGFEYVSWNIISREHYIPI